MSRLAAFEVPLDCAMLLGGRGHAAARRTIEHMAARRTIAHLDMDAFANALQYASRHGASA
jgi:hypothetical protein